MGMWMNIEWVDLIAYCELGDFHELTHLILMLPPPLHIIVVYNF